MTLEVIEPETKEIIAPALQVAMGELSWQQANTNYVGLELPCIHCWQALQGRSIEGSRDNPIVFRRVDYVNLEVDVYSGPFGAVEAELSDSSILSKFKKGYQHGNNRRWMHFAHRQGFSKQFEALPCHDSRTKEHALAVAVFRRLLFKQYREKFPKVEVLEEKRLIIKPGEPPITRRPDLVVEVDGTILECAEVQRSRISFDDFVSRTNHLKSRSPKVTWYITREVYSSGSFSHSRDWLSSKGIPYYYYWIDDKTFQIQYSEGRPRTKAKKEKRKLESSESVLPGKGSCKHFVDLIEADQIDIKPSVKPVIQDPIFVENEQHVARRKASGVSTKPSSQRETNNKSSQIPPQQFYSDFSVGDEVRFYVDGETEEGRIISFNNGIPLVSFTSRRRGRFVERKRSPTNPSDIRKLIKPQSEEPQQLSLLG